MESEPSISNEYRHVRLESDALDFFGLAWNEKVGRIVEAYPLGHLAMLL